MSSILRRENGTIVVTARITLKPGRDDELIDMINHAERIAPSIREAMRNGITRFVISDQEIDDVCVLPDVGIEL